MAKLVYQEPEDFMVRVSISSILSFLKFNPFRIEIDLEKINSILNNSTESNFLVFPEYTYSEDLENLYQEHCDRNECIIVGGSGLEPIGNDFYSFCPIFIPNSPIIKIYKKQITHPEITLSNGKIIAYPDEVQRRIELNLDDRDISFSVYICYDFLIENKNKRTDLIFVPQYEASPEQFITESDKISKGYTNFVFGANNCNNNQRSLGFAVLNRALIESLHIQQLRREAYRDAESNTLNYDHTIFYDVNDERLMTFDVNIGRPFSLPYNFTLNGHQPVLIPRRNMPI